MRWVRKATECRNRPTDWATLGTRIIQTAAVAAAVHMAERLQVVPPTETDLRPRTAKAELDAQPGAPRQEGRKESDAGKEIVED
ncbi:MAG TPA: hypothetical protein PLL20_08705 [Phycisphaerae bacterium]|nr:hypothetical protein [Phycisphaerae bacterium]HRR87211.1 hypothetical protein [Phycisphaerae bacterium]